MNRQHPLRIGFFAIGLDAYWPQFAGLEERLRGYAATVADRMAAADRVLVDCGLIDTPEKALAAGQRMRREDVDLIVLHVTTYALSHTVLPVVRRAGVPVLVLNLQPGRAIDYAAFNALEDRTRMTGEWLAWCAACPVPEIANVFRRAGIAFHQLTGTLEASDPVWSDLEDWLAAASVARTMAHNRCGLLGHYYNGMLDIYADLTQQVASLGGHFEICEVEELVALRDQVDEEETQRRIAAFHEDFDIRADCAPAELDRAARTACALDRLVETHALGSLAYYHMGSGVPAAEDVMSSVILGTSQLTARGIPVAGEYEVKNVQAMKILDSFGVGGSFTEYYGIDFDDDIVLMGHDGPGHIAIAEGRTRVRPLAVYHGKVGTGLSVEMSVRHGPVTLLAVAEDQDHGLRLVCAEGVSEAGPILEIGNTNSRYRFPCGARDFVERWNDAGPAHHCAVGIGHCAERIGKLGALLDLPVRRIC
ncbi:MAG: arabinose isomerase [Planctomycetota bacterium]